MNVEAKLDRVIALLEELIRVSTPLCPKCKGEGGRRDMYGGWKYCQRCDGSGKQ